ncbi:MAG: Na-translocating system protein MpsC family protein [Thermincolia bacterium]
MSKGMLEDVVTKALIQWEKDYMGRGPTEAKTDIIRDMIVVSLKGVLSTAEEHLAKDVDGMALVKKLRQLLVEQGRANLEDILFRLTSAKVVSLHTDISTKTGERIFIFRMNRTFD